MATVRTCDKCGKTFAENEDYYKLTGTSGEEIDFCSNDWTQFQSWMTTKTTTQQPAVEQPVQQQPEQPAPTPAPVNQPSPEPASGHDGQPTA